MSEIAERAARRIWCIQSGCENIEVCNHVLNDVDLAEVRIFQFVVERAIAESQAPQPTGCNRKTCKLSGDKIPALVEDGANE